MLLLSVEEIKPWIPILWYLILKQVFVDLRFIFEILHGFLCFLCLIFPFSLYQHM